MSRGNPRRASGTRTFLDLLRSFASPPPGHDDDVADLLGGATLVVAAWRRADGRWHRGTLVLCVERTAPVEWRPSGLRRRRRTVPLSPPYAVQGASTLGPGRSPVDRHEFRQLDLDAGATPWQLAVPARDVALIRRALDEAARRAGASDGR